MELVEPTFQMWVVLGLMGAALVLYVSELLPMEVTSLGMLMVLLLLFQWMPLTAPDGRNLLTTEALLSGFANPALLTVLALLVVSEALVQTGALDRLGHLIGHLPFSPRVSIAIALVVVTATSAVLNDTPVVVIFLPVMQAMALRLHVPASKLMMPLSFAAILGGVITMVGSSTNLLVSSALTNIGLPPLTMFQVTPLGLIQALVGLVYLLVLMPRLLPRRRDSFELGVGGGGRHYVSQCHVPAGSPLVGERAVAGRFPSLPDVTVHLVHRGERVVLPPFDEIDIRPGDVLVIAATRKALTSVNAKHPGLIHPPSAQEKPDPGEDADEPVLVEAMVPPNSAWVGRTVLQIGLRRRYGVVVLGIQRRARMLRERMLDMPLQAGDELLMQGLPRGIDQTCAERNLVAISGSRTHLPKPHYAGISVVVFVMALLLAGLGVAPIAVTAIGAATLLIAIGAITPRRAAAALDRKIVLLVGNALALGAALEATGGAAWLAQSILLLLGDVSPAMVLCVFFGLVAVITNLLSNNACAVLFTPIGVGLAHRLGVDPHIFAIATVLAANCSFATPIGYQTNLLVMGPGGYRFRDYVRAGLPLTVLLWVVFSLAAPWYYGLSW